MLRSISALGKVARITISRLLLLKKVITSAAVQASGDPLLLIEATLSEIQAWMLKPKPLTNHMAKTDFRTVDAYHATFPPATRNRLETIRKIIRETAPDAEEIISYQIPAYKYRGYLIYYAGFQNHVSISSPFSEALLANFKKELAPYKKSRAAIQFPHDGELPVRLIRDIVKFRKKENEEKQAAGTKDKVQGTRDKGR
jgi:uncharacterized protein YdhG (YjbR/CyaY superfamily)